MIEQKEPIIEKKESQRSCTGCHVLYCRAGSQFRQESTTFHGTLSEWNSFKRSHLNHAKQIGCKGLVVLHTKIILAAKPL